VRPDAPLHWQFPSSIPRAEEELDPLVELSSAVCHLMTSETDSSNSYSRIGVGVVVCATLLACGGRGAPERVSFGGHSEVAVTGLRECSSSSREPLPVDPNEDLTVLVHGCNSSAAAFSTLARVFEHQGQRAVCFTYDDRDSLISSADEFGQTLEAISQRMGRGTLTVIGHSQGGLVARTALSGKSRASVKRLVTVSSPFNGIESASHCGMPWFHAMSFGITVGVCQAVTGRKWTEIYPGSPFMESPSPLSSGVGEHLVVITDEAGTCLERSVGGGCEESDFIFSVEEQTATQIQGDRTRTKTLAVGHVAVVGEQGVEPWQLIELLQEEEVLRSVAIGEKTAFRSFVQRAYAEDPERPTQGAMPTQVAVRRTSAQDGERE